MSFCFVQKKSHGLYGEKRKFRPYIETKLQFLHSLYGGIFSQDVLYYTNKNQRSSIFVSIPHCPMDYCIPACSTVVFLLNKALLVIVWNNLNSNSVKY